MSGNGTRQSLQRELERQIEIHQEAINRLGMTFAPEAIMQHRDVWLVPYSIGAGIGDADDVLAMARIIRRSLEGETNLPVSVLLDPTEV